MPLGPTGDCVTTCSVLRSSCTSCHRQQQGPTREHTMAHTTASRNYCCSMHLQLQLQPRQTRCVALQEQQHRMQYTQQYMHQYGLQFNEATVQIAVHKVHVAVQTTTQQSVQKVLKQQYTHPRGPCRNRPGRTRGPRPHSRCTAAPGTGRAVHRACCGWSSCGGADVHTTDDTKVAAR